MHKRMVKSVKVVSELELDSGTYSPEKKNDCVGQRGCGE